MAVKTILSPSDAAVAAVGREKRRPFGAFQATVATGTIGGFLADRKYRLRGLRTRVGDCGASGTTTVQVHSNGSAISGAELSTGNAETNGTVKGIGLDVAVAADEALELVVSAAAGSATDLAVDVILVEDEGT